MTDLAPVPLSAVSYHTDEPLAADARFIVRAVSGVGVESADAYMGLTLDGRPLWEGPARPWDGRDRPIRLEREPWATADRLRAYGRGVASVRVHGTPDEGSP